MTPRLRLVLLAAAAAAVVAALLAAGWMWDGARPRPNIVIVVWDTNRGDRTTVNGYARPTTPRLEGLAARGVTFRQCITPAPWTAPAHASLFTGLLPQDHWLREGMGERIRPGIPLLAQTLADAGYETVAVVANPRISKATGLDAGFERCLARYREGDGSATGDSVAESVRHWAAERRTAPGNRRPAFLFVNLMEAHLPYAFDAASVAAVRGLGSVEGARHAAAAVGNLETTVHQVGMRRIDPRTIQDLGAAYDGAVLRNDRITGRILGDLEFEGILEEAFVAVTADHGENLGEHGELNHSMSVYEPVLHVPLVLRWPGRFEGGRVVEEQVGLQDLYPTILEAARVPVPEPCGKDAIPLTGNLPPARALVSEYGPMPRSLEEARQAFPGAPQEVYDRFRLLFRSVRESPTLPGARKLVSVFRAVKGRDPELVREELYDIASDPGETRNLLGGDAPEAERAAAARLRRAGAAGP